jgi:hypothetical protein
MQSVNSFISSTVVGDSLRLKNQGFPVSGLSFALFAKGADAEKLTCPQILVQPKLQFQ